MRFVQRKPINGQHWLSFVLCPVSKPQRVSPQHLPFVELHTDCISWQRCLLSCRMYCLLPPLVYGTWEPSATANKRTRYCHRGTATKCLLMNSEERETANILFTNTSVNILVRWTKNILDRNIITDRYSCYLKKIVPFLGKSLLDLIFRLFLKTYPLLSWKWYTSQPTIVFYWVFHLSPTSCNPSCTQTGMEYLSTSRRKLHTRPLPILYDVQTRIKFRTHEYEQFS